MNLSARASNAIDGMCNPDKVIWTDGRRIVRWRDMSADGEWFDLARVSNLGAKTIAELLSTKSIERKSIGPPIVYRLIADRRALDFGDLWVA
jgi:hypothetical protein